MPSDKAQASVVISGSGLWTPPYSISNKEIADSYNKYAERVNAERFDAIVAGQDKHLLYSDPDFIEKASGIKNRFVIDKEGILDSERLRPYLAPRGADELSYQAEMSVEAANEALRSACKSPKQIGAVIAAAANIERPYPAVAIEVQNELGINGFGFDMQVGCSSAVYALQRAYEMVASGIVESVLVVNPELFTPQVNFADRDSHFIFGDVATAVIVERREECSSSQCFEILSTRALTTYSNNIRADVGYLSRVHDVDPSGVESLFTQNGRRVFKEVCPMVVNHLKAHLDSLGLSPGQVNRWWLHQANSNMNNLIAKKLLGHEPSHNEAPTVLDLYGNTASAGCILAFNQYQKDMEPSDLGVLCSFGAGYSVGSLVLKKTHT